jgi:hypothetical protein
MTTARTVAQQVNLAAVPNSGEGGCAGTAGRRAAAARRRTAAGAGGSAATGGRTTGGRSAAVDPRRPARGDEPARRHDQRGEPGAPARAARRHDRQRGHDRRAGTTGAGTAARRVPREHGLQADRVLHLGRLSRRCRRTTPGCRFNSECGFGAAAATAPATSLRHQPGMRTGDAAWGLLPARSRIGGGHCVLNADCRRHLRQRLLPRRPCARRTAAPRSLRQRLCRRRPPAAGVQPNTDCGGGGACA